MNTNTARRAALALNAVIAAYGPGGLNFKAEKAVRVDGVVFERLLETTRWGARWTAWAPSGETVDPAALPAWLEAGFGRLYRADNADGIRLPKVASVASPAAAAETPEARRARKLAQIAAETVAGFWLGSAAKHVEDIAAGAAADARAKGATAYALARHPLDQQALHSMLGRCPTWEEECALEARTCSLLAA